MRSSERGSADVFGEDLGDKEVLSLGEVVCDHAPESLCENRVVVVQDQRLSCEPVVVDKFDLRLVGWERLVVGLCGNCLALSDLFGHWFRFPRVNDFK